MQNHGRGHTALLTVSAMWLQNRQHNQRQRGPPCEARSLPPQKAHATPQERSSKQRRLAAAGRRGGAGQKPGSGPLDQSPHEIHWRASTQAARSQPANNIKLERFRRLAGKRPIPIPAKHGPSRAHLLHCRAWTSPDQCQPNIDGGQHGATSTTMACTWGRNSEVVVDERAGQRRRIAQGLAQLDA